MYEPDWFSDLQTRTILRYPRLFTPEQIAQAGADAPASHAPEATEMGTE